MTPEQQHLATGRSPRTLRRTAQTASASRAVVVGLARDVPRALEHPAFGSSRGFEVCGVVTVAPDDEDVRAHAEALHHLVEAHSAGIVMVAGPLGPMMMRAVNDLALLHGCRLLAVMPSEVVAGHEPRIVWEGESPLVQLAEHRHSRLQFAVKRVMDVVGAAAGIVITSPLMLLIAAGIKLESRGPVLFRHWRVGRDGAGFHCLKFRTMRADAEAVLLADPELLRLYRENHYKLPEHLDPRVTRFGRLLRRTSLDELPQLFNVLMGEMSLVGPRPVVEDELEHYHGSERLLLSVRPGMTGAWAVNGRHHVGYPARAELELRYVRGWGIARDVGILASTFGAVLDPGSDVDTPTAVS
jgi:exopolysaccharide production protein ExoY